MDATPAPLPPQRPDAMDAIPSSYATHSADGAFVSIYYWFAKKIFRIKRPSSDEGGIGKHNDKGNASTADAVQASAAVDVEAVDTTSTPRSHASAVLKRGLDYAKMGDVGSGSADSEPLAGRVGRVKDFLHQVNGLPWVATDRVTVDYYPGKSRKRPQIKQRPLQSPGPRHVRSWYSERGDILPFTSLQHENNQPQQEPLPSSTAGDDAARSQNGDVGRIYPTGYVPAVAQQDDHATFA